MDQNTRIKFYLAAVFIFLEGAIVLFYRMRDWSRTSASTRCRLGFHTYQLCHDTVTNLYYECARCHKRIAHTRIGSAHQPLHTDWLAGGEWETPFEFETQPTSTTPMDRWPTYPTS